MTWTGSARKGKEHLATVLLFAMTISNLAALPQLVPYLRSGYQNFTIFYAAGQMVRAGQTANLYDLSQQYRAQKAFAPNVNIRQAALPYNHPPFEALLFVPFTRMSYWKAYLVWTLVNLILLAASVAFLRKHFAEIRSLSPILVGLAATAFFPIVSSIIQGHDCILLLFLYVLAAAAFAGEHDVASGALLAVGLFRFQLVLPLVLILAVRRCRMLLGFIPVAALLAGVSVAMVGWQGAIEYVNVILNLEKTGAGGSIVAASMPNLRGMIAGIPGINATQATVLTLIGSIAVFAVVMWQIRVTRYSALYTFTLATVAALLVSYHALTYDLSLLFPAVLFLFAIPSSGGRPGRLDTVLLAVFFLLPRFDLLGSWISPVCGFAVFLFWLFSKREAQALAAAQPL